MSSVDVGAPTVPWVSENTYSQYSKAMILFFTGHPPTSHYPFFEMSDLSEGQESRAFAPRPVTRDSILEALSLSGNLALCVAFTNLRDTEWRKLMKDYRSIFILYTVCVEEKFFFPIARYSQGDGS